MKPSWTEAKNKRRYDLIMRKYSDTGLPPAETDELALLQTELAAHRQRVAPLPIEEAKRYIRQLIDSETDLKTHYDQLSDSAKNEFFESVADALKWRGWARQPGGQGMAAVKLDLIANLFHRERGVEFEEYT